MRNVEVVEAFLAGEKPCKTKTVFYTEDNKLIHYQTVIAQFMYGTLVVNDTHYSRTTSKLQTQLKSRITQGKVAYVHNIPEGCKDLGGDYK